MLPFDVHQKGLILYFKRFLSSNLKTYYIKNPESIVEMAYFVQNRPPGSLFCTIFGSQTYKISQLNCSANFMTLSESRGPLNFFANFIWLYQNCILLISIQASLISFFALDFTQQGPWVLGVTDRSSTPDVPPDLRAPEILPKPMELLENETRAKIYKERTARVREYCKYMKNDSMINDWIEHPG